MSNVKQLVRQLASHGITKKGAVQNANSKKLDVLEYPNLEIPGVSWKEFFTVDFPKSDFAQLPVHSDALAEHQKEFPSIRKSSWEERDGHVYMEVPLDGSVPADAIISMIDDAHSIVWNKLDGAAKLEIELAGKPYDEKQFIDRLIETNDLQKHSQEIHKLARPAILLRTKKSSEAKIPIGASKIGGKPDLPADTKWPIYSDGKPLAFLAQLNMSEIAQVGAPIKGLPADGLISIFSAWGWTTEDNRDPQTPKGDDEQTGWTVAIITPAKGKLERTKPPKGVKPFKAAAVEPVSILSLPNSNQEPAVTALNWPDDVYERYDEMQMGFRALQMGYWLKDYNSLASHHLLGGYALFQQEYPEDLPEGLAMFLQIGSDDKTGMEWSDGGELTFYADAKSMAKGNIERIWGTCQGG